VLFWRSGARRPSKACPLQAFIYAYSFYPTDRAARALMGFVLPDFWKLTPRVKR
jgi:hypothetical protein